MKGDPLAISYNDNQSLYTVANWLDVKNPQWLIDLINFESGMNPSQKNLMGSSAKGLIQFMDSTARGMGYSSSQDLINKHPTIKSQMEGPVYEYLKPYKPFNTESSLYLSVFFPAARKYPSNTPFSEIYNKIYGSSGPSRYKTFERQNPGIKTPQDYINFVKRKPLKRIAVRGGIGIASVGLIYIAYRAIK